MKHWLATAAAVTAAPLLVACASAGAATGYAETDDRHQNVLIVNGERIVVRDGSHAIHIIEDALEDGGETSLTLDFDFDAQSWSEEDLEAFESEMEELGESLSLMFAEGSNLQIALERLDINEDALDARIEVIVEQAERRAERAERLAERAAERAERDTERQARRAEHHARRAVEQALASERQASRAETQALRAAERALETERHAISISIDADSIAQAGLMAAETGLESGLAAIERTLENGWKTENGERVPLTRQDREELRQAREELEESLAELREERADWHEERRAPGMTIRTARCASSSAMARPASGSMAAN